MDELVARSIRVIRWGQADTGAYLACPTYPTYQYCWFRDGTFIAHAMDRWGEYDSATRFFNWAASMIGANAASVERVVDAIQRGAAPEPRDLLHTRYSAHGDTSATEWPNHQLDGFGTLLWGFGRHLRAVDLTLPGTWREAVRVLISYLGALWSVPNSDCWEEHADRLAVSTLAALYAGLRSAAQLLDPSPAASVAERTAAAVRDLVLERGVRDGHLIKQIDGADEVDASLLWASLPFGEHALFAPLHPIMRATAARIESDLVGRSGGVHRFLDDTFYGGGEWVLLTALLGEYRLSTGDRPGAERCRAFAAAQADAAGNLPEQSSAAVLAPSRIQEWVDLWGPVARPLLWSHAGYLSLMASLRDG